MVGKNEFYENFLQDILTESESRGLMKSESFFESVCEELVEIGDITANYTYADYYKEQSTGTIEIYGFDYDEERKMLTLINQIFNQDNYIVAITKADIENRLNRTRRFLMLSAKKLYQNLEETSPAYSMAFNIYQLLSETKVDKIRFMLLTDGENRAKKDFDMVSNLNDIPVEYRIIDISYLYNIFSSNNEEDDFSVNVNLDYMEAEKQEDYSSYLTIIKGTDLYDIYEQYGQKLLEQNVRTFLQFKGKVNQGLRNTIEKFPEKFFAYNNGITATASDIIFGPDKKIKKIENFQIVNGGQTTSAIYAAKKNNGIDISKIFVQMKLSVVKEKEKLHEFVSKVSEYANTQNKINKSDFFSNSPFHIDVKSYSKNIWAPAVSGSQKRTRWFYERVRGEYLNEQAYMSISKKKSFLIENPKSQLFDKTFLSKSEVSWHQRPDVVSKGAQYSFSYFADVITEMLEKNSLAITESYFKEMISRIIIFKNLEKLISGAIWYKDGYRAQTVTYTLAYFSKYLKENNLNFNFELIWREQSVPEELERIFDNLGNQIYKYLNNPSDGSANIGQWCKKNKCWEELKKIDLPLHIPEYLLVDSEAAKYIEREAKKQKKMDVGINEQSFVVNLMETTIWNELYSHYSKYEKDSRITATQMDILKKMAEFKLIPPSEKQSKILYQLYQKGISENVISHPKL